MTILRVTCKYHIGWMDGILGEVDGGKGKPSNVGEKLGELVDGLQIPNMCNLSRRRRIRSRVLKLAKV